ncbi:MAG: hypothetical protein ACKOQS_07350 [Dolichospermum sp.]
MLLKQKIHQLLPISIAELQGEKHIPQIYVTISLQRSGQHAIINWLCHQIQSIVHFNNCDLIRKNLSISPISRDQKIISYVNQNQKEAIGNKTYIGNDFSLIRNELKQAKNLLYSFEDFSLNHNFLKKMTKFSNVKVVFILRDPYNCFASSLKRRERLSGLDINRNLDINKKKALFITYLEQTLNIKDYLHVPIVAIDYTKWLTSINYRSSILTQLDIPWSSEADSYSLKEVQSFGGGSSFSGTNIDAEYLHSQVLQRWHEYKDDPEYRELLSDEYLLQLSDGFFDIRKPF